jgi:antagonist of KipI
MESVIDVFQVLDPGILTTIQDLGRFGFSQIGVPPSGALDSFSLRVGNLLVGNEEGEAGSEMTIMGMKLRALEEVVIAVTGGDLTPTLNGDPLEMWKSHLLIKGDMLTFKGVRRGCRTYLAVGGGLAVPKIMGSKSTFLSGQFGGLEGRPLKKGDLLSTSGPRRPLGKIGVRFPDEWVPAFERDVNLRVIPGPQDHHFTELGLRTFRSSFYPVTAQCDRMGIRLDGPKIERRSDVEESIISESLIPGSIQVPGDGKPLIILNESVTGGYAKIATVISTDLPKVAQLKPGDRVRFGQVLIEEAHRLLREQEERIKRFRDALHDRL